MSEGKGARPDDVDDERVLARFVILGTPATKKNSARIITNRSTGTPMLLPSKNARKWEQIVAWKCASMWRRAPIAVPVAVDAQVYRFKAQGDLINYLQCIADALEYGRVLANDSLILSWDGSRMHVDVAHPRVELVIRTFDP